MYVGNQPGGQLTTTNDVENFPGFPEGIGGTEMMEIFAKQAKRFETDVRYGTVTEVDFSSKPHLITIDKEKKITADAVIIATGASAKWLGLPSESRLNGSGVSACAVCDGFFYRKQTEGQHSKLLFFVEKGTLHFFVTDEQGKNHTIQFGFEGHWITDLYSFLSDRPAIFTIEALEAITILAIKQTDFERVCRKIPKFEHFFRILIQNVYVNSQQ